MANLRRAGDLQDVEGADQIGVDIAARVLEAVADTGLRGEVDDDIRRRRRGRGPNGAFVFQEADMAGEACGL